MLTIIVLLLSNVFWDKHEFAYEKQLSTEWSEKRPLKNYQRKNSKYENRKL